MTKENIETELKNILNRKELDEDLWCIMTRQELIDADGEDEKKSLYDNDYDWVIMYSDNPDFCFISNGEEITSLRKNINDWLQKIKSGY